VIAARRRLLTGGYTGQLVARGHTSARAQGAAGDNLVPMKVLWHTSARVLWVAGDYSVLMRMRLRHLGAGEDAEVRKCAGATGGRRRLGVCEDEDDVAPVDGAEGQQS
jgi:hypothetical protein